MSDDNLEFTKEDFEVRRIDLGNFGCIKLHADCKRVSFVIFGKSGVVIQMHDEDPDHYHRMDKNEFGELIKDLQKLHSKMEGDKP